MPTNRLNASAAPVVDLRILATSDIHGDILGVDYFSRNSGSENGFARCAGLIRSERQKALNTLLLDNGDFLQGTPLSDHFFEAGTFRDVPHPLIAAMNALDYDAVALGNHEFTFGLDPLIATLNHARFPVLCANLHGAIDAEDAAWRERVFPSRLLTRAVAARDGGEHDLKIGLFAVLPPAVLKWEETRIGNRLTATPMLDAAHDAVAALRLQGADIVVALAHSGLVASGSDGHGENVGADIARLTGVDVLIAGHTHEVFPTPDYPDHPGIDAAGGRVHGVPTVMMGSGGSHLGRIDLQLMQSADGWRVATADVMVLPVAGSEADHEIVAVASPFHHCTLDHIARPVATLSHPVHSYFALVTEDLSTRLVAKAKAALVRDRLLGTALADLPVLGVAAPFKSGGPGRRGQYTDVAAGIISGRDIADMQLYPNDVAALVLSGSQLRDWLDMGAGQYAEVHPGYEDQPLILSRFPSYNRDFVSGVTFEIDLAAPPRFDPAGRMRNPDRTRIVNLRHEGRVIAAEDRFVIATNNYRAGGGGNFPGIKAMQVALITDVPVRHALTEFLRRTGGEVANAGPGWRFSAVPGSSVLFETHPRAMARLDDVPWLPLSPVSETADTLTLRLSLGGDCHLASFPNRDYIGA